MPFDPIRKKFVDPVLRSAGIPGWDSPHPDYQYFENRELRPAFIRARDAAETVSDAAWASGGQASAYLHDAASRAHRDAASAAAESGHRHQQQYHEKMADFHVRSAGAARRVEERSPQ